MTICPDVNFGRCPVCGGVGKDNPSPGSAFSTYAVPANLVSNGNFVDGVNSNWTVNSSPTTLELETSIVKGAYSAKITPSSYLLSKSVDYVYQDIHDAEGISYWQGKKVTLYCWVKTNQAGKVSIGITDGVETATSIEHSGNDRWERLKVVHTINASATRVQVLLRTEEWLVILGTYSAYFDGVALANNEDLALSVQARILREAIVDADSDVAIRTDKDKGYTLEYYQGELMCQLCIKRRKKEEEDEIARDRYREDQELRDRFGYRRSMED